MLPAAAELATEDTKGDDDGDDEEDRLGAVETSAEVAVPVLSEPTGPTLFATVAALASRITGM